MIPVSTETLKKTLNLEAVENDVLFEKHKLSILAEITRITEQEHYNRALSDADENETRAAAFELAYCYLMFAQVADLLNLGASDKGFVSTIGFDSDRVSLLSVEQISALQSKHKKSAFKALLPYLNAAGRAEYRRQNGEIKGQQCRVAVV